MNRKMKIKWTKKKIVITIIVYFIGILAIYNSITYQRGYVNKGIKIEKDKNLVRSINQLTSQSEEKLKEQKKTQNIGEYYKLMDTMQQFFDAIEYKDYDLAVNMLDNNFKDYKKIRNVDDFKQYINYSNRINKICDIKRYEKIEDSNDCTKYVCDIVMYQRHVDDKYKDKKDFNEYIDSQKNNIEKVTITYSKNKKFISLEGVIDKKEFNISGSNAQFDVLIKSCYHFDDNMIFEIQIANKSESTVNLGELFFNIILKDDNDNVYFADKISDEVTNEILPKKKNILRLKISSGVRNGNKLILNFNNKEIKALEFNLRGE